MLRLAVIVLALTGCDVVFSLDRPPSDASVEGDADSSVPGVKVTVEIGLDVIVPAPNFTFVTSSEPLESSVTAVLADGTSRQVSRVDTHYEFERTDADQDYRFTYTPPLTTRPVTYVGQARALYFIDALFGRIARDPVTPLTKAMATSLTSTAYAYALTTGLRTKTLVNMSPTSHAGFTLDWPTVAPLSGPRGMPAASELDRLHHATYNLVAGPGYFTIATISTAPLTLSPGVTTPIAMPTPTNIAGVCLSLTAKRAREQTRVMTALGASNVTSTWTIESTPRPERTAVGGLPLAWKDTSITTDGTETIVFLNPFSDEGTVLRLATEGSVDIGGVMIAVDTEAYFRVPTPSCSPVPALVAEGTTGFASAITIDGQDTTGPVSVSDGRIAWTLVDGTADFFVVEIVEIGVATPRATYITTSREVLADADILQSGKRYFVQVTAQNGYPGAAIGDFRPLLYPNGRTVAPSHSFLVQ